MRIEREEGELLDQLLKARHEAGLTQAQVAERMVDVRHLAQRKPAALSNDTPSVNDEAIDDSA